MSGKNQNLIGKDNIVQAIIVADTFNDEFVPISDTIPLCLLPLVNKPLIDYTLEFLSLGGIDETFVFCCSHIDAIKKHINKSVLSMKITVIASETCRSFGDCLRDLDAKGLLRGDFVLLEPGTISNVDLIPLIKRHNALTKVDKGAAMTLILQEAGVGYHGRCAQEELLIATSNKNRVLLYKKIGKTRDRKVDFPLEIFLDNSEVSLLHNLKDTHMAICSSSVLPLFSDNFDFQSKDDFVRGLLMNEEILGSTVYCDILKGSHYGGAVVNWNMYQSISRELINKWIFPLQPCLKTNRLLRNEVAIDKSTKPNHFNLVRTVIGANVSIGKNVKIEDSFIMSNSQIGDNVRISRSVVGPFCVVKSNNTVSAGSILGEGVVLEEGKFVEDALVQATEPEFCDEKDKLGKKAYRLKLDVDSDDEDVVDSKLARKFSRFHINDYESQYNYGFSDSDDDGSYAESIPDDTNLFFTEVIDSLTRGFDDQLLCDNLILEINSSRYAYNVTVKEVNFNVMKAIFTISLRQSIGPQFFSYFSRLLTYFTAILKNYIRNESAMNDCLKAVEEVVLTSDKVTGKWVVFVLQYFYNKDYITEDVILKWAKSLDNDKLSGYIQPFIDWLQEAEEASSSEDDEGSD